MVSPGPGPDLYPQTEAQAQTCVHGNRYWYGHECGLCPDYVAAAPAPVPTDPDPVLSPDQVRRIRQRAIARNKTPQQILDALVPVHSAWTPRELDMLRNPHNSSRSIAVATGRSRSAVYNRRHLLAVEENITGLLRPRRPPPPEAP